MKFSHIYTKCVAILSLNFCFVVSTLFASPTFERVGGRLAFDFDEPVSSWSLSSEAGEHCARSQVGSGSVKNLKFEHVSVADNLILNYTTKTGTNNLFVSSQRRPSNQKKPVRDVAIYQLPVRTYFAEGEGASSSGNFKKFTKQHLASIKAKGIDYLWLTGVLQQATRQNTDPDVVKGEAGSFYAIVDSWSVSSDLGSVGEFLNLIDSAHKIGLKVVIDLVVNHTARMHKTRVLCKQNEDLGKNDNKSKSFDSANNYFYINNGSNEFIPPLQSEVPGADGIFDTVLSQKGIQFEIPSRVTGNDVQTNRPSINDWFETAKLNYGYDFSSGRKAYYPVPRTWKQVSSIAEYWLKLGVDGFRVDFAHAVPIEFWRYFTHRLKSVNPEVFLLAEAYEADFAMKVPGFDYESLLDAGFDSIYNSEFYWDLRKLVDLNRPPIMANYSRSPAMRKSILRKGYRFTNYLENHDEIRVASQEFAPNIHNVVSRANIGFNYSVYSALLPGNFMIHGGQEFMEDASIFGEFAGDNGKTSIFDFVYQPSTQAALNGSASPASELLTQKYHQLLKLKQSEAFSVRHSLDAPSYVDLNFANRAFGQGQWLGAYARFSDEQKFLVVLNSDIASSHEVTIHFTDKDNEDPSGILKKLGIENSEKRYIFVEVLNKDGWVPKDPNIAGVGIPGWVLYKAGNIPSGVFLGKLEPGASYVFKIVEF